ncbi:magnesium transporter [Methanocella arvoryzae]|uniref:Predicted cation transporter n=1 Tax=Methanocella arvoryzae (strain DSM 22066 / NBRC 105507 / MRE50) TaxID=351160 RepID=Q0W8Z6_METAR|nr:CBS domain-containing protein [Methanocella arvoryzae]CAJ35130.1 predicted cation transporter [Methanocella arvoryzae MRE50]
MSLSKSVSSIISSLPASAAFRGPEGQSIENVAYFSTFQGQKVIDSEGRVLGRIKDFAITPGESLLEVSRIVYMSNILRDSITVPMASVASFDGSFRLKIPREEIPPGKLSEHEMLIVETILDKQIVDIDGLKVVRVNDVLLTRVKDKLCVVGVDVGFKGILRRLGLGWVSGRLLTGMPDNLIAWSYIDPLDPGLRRIHLKIPRKKIGDLHPADIADIIEELDRKEQLLILESLGDEKAAETLEEVEPDVQAKIVKHMDSDDVADILENMNPDDAADVIHMMPREKACEVLKLMDEEEASDVKELLRYSHRSAGGLMTNEFISIPIKSRVADAFDRLRELGSEVDMIYYVYVLDDKERLTGVLSLRDLLLSKPEQCVSEVMKSEILRVLPDTTGDEVANLLSKYDLLAIPVTDNEGVMLGVVTFDDALEDVLPEDLRKQLPQNYRMIRKVHRGHGP